MNKTIADVTIELAKQKAKELELASYKNDMKYFKVLLKPKNVKQIALEAEDYNKRIRKGEENNILKDELIALRMEFVTRRDKYKYTCGLVHELPCLVPRIEKNTLMKLFFDLEGYTWSNNFGWSGQSKTITRHQIDPLEASPIFYDGLTIEVSEDAKDNIGHIIGINLTGNGCVGKLTEDLGKLEKCQYLQLGWNLLNNKIPKSISNLKYLTVLDVSCNRLGGSLDNDVFHLLVNLETLNLSSNYLTGIIPSSIGQLVKLTILNLSSNQFTGSIPTTICNLIVLKEMKLYNNKLSGEIPLGISKLVKLQYVNLSNNQLSNGLNNFNFNFNLKQLLLNNNYIEDKIEKTISNLKKLEILYLQNNRIHGYLPDELCMLLRLRRLNACNNDLCGVIPDDIGNLLNLESLILNNNAFKGPMPLSISNIKKLRDFHVFKSYPSEMMSYGQTAFHRQEFNRVYVFGPSVGIDSIHWDSKKLYGAEKKRNGEEETIKIFGDSMK